MKSLWQSRRLGAFCQVFVVSMLTLVGAHAQSCETSAELDDATRVAITTAGQNYFGLAAKGDVESIRQNSTPTLAADFSGIETRVKDHQKDLAGAQATVKSVFLLDASGTQTIPHAEFLCGVFDKNGQTPGSAAFYLDNLPAGRYAVVLLEASSSQGTTMFSEMLQQTGAAWKLWGLYINPTTIAGHDSNWFLAKAREYKAKGQTHNAWMYYLQGRNLVSSVPFMYTLATDKLYEEWHSLQPADLPADGKTVDLATGAATYKLTAVFPVAVGSDLDLVVKYTSANVSDNNLAYRDNVAVIKAILAKYPELKDAFTSIVARAVDASGRDYGTLMAVKDIK